MVLRAGAVGRSISHENTTWLLGRVHANGHDWRWVLFSLYTPHSLKASVFFVQECLNCGTRCVELRISRFGGLSMRADESADDIWGGTVTFYLLQYLALHPPSRFIPFVHAKRLLMSCILDTLCVV
jgi:hypothetical protein